MLTFKLGFHVLVAVLCTSTQLVQALSTAEDVDVAAFKSKYLPAEYAKSNFTLDDAQRMLRQKCKRAGVTDPQVYDNIEKASVRLMECAHSIGNLTEVLAEVEAARPVGELDVVFQKYCAKEPYAEKCLHEFNTALLACLTPEERVQNQIIMRIVTSLLSFICYKNGEPIAIFIAEEGPECIEANKENIINCMNSTFAAYMPKAGAANESGTELPELVMGPKQCIDLYDFEECVLGYLETCNEITPSNLVESIFKYVKNETKCQPEIDKVVGSKLAVVRNASASLRQSEMLLLLTLTAVMCAIRRRY